MSGRLNMAMRSTRWLGIQVCFFPSGIEVRVMTEEAVNQFGDGF
jgi:hypothetical protein